MPDHIKICGQIYPIRTDFREWIKLELAFSVNDQIKVIKAISDILYGKFPDNMQICLDHLINFYNCGENKNDGDIKPHQKKIYDFEVDQSLIFTAFMQYYHIDLSSTKIHWWAFRNMLFELPEDCKFMKVMMYRSVKITSQMSKEQRQFYAKMKRLYALPDNRTKEEKANMVGAVFASGMVLKE